MKAIFQLRADGLLPDSAFDSVGHVLQQLVLAVSIWRLTLVLPENWNLLPALHAHSAPSEIIRQTCKCHTYEFRQY